MCFVNVVWIETAHFRVHSLDFVFTKRQHKSRALPLICYPVVVLSFFIMKWLKVTLTASVPDMGRILLVSNVVVDSLGVKGKGPGMRVSRKRAHNQSKNALKKKTNYEARKSGNDATSRATHAVARHTFRPLFFLNKN